jgi:transcriptional regulator with XRE-family HTH domain
MNDTYLKRRREELGLTQRQVAERLGLTPQAVSSWENGDSFPRLSMLAAVASVYRVTPNDLATAIAAPPCNARAEVA